MQALVLLPGHLSSNHTLYAVSQSLTYGVPMCHVEALMPHTPPLHILEGTNKINQLQSGVICLMNAV